MKWKDEYEDCVRKVCEQFREEKLHCTYECDPKVGWCDVYFRLEKVACIRWYVDTQEIYFIHCPTKWVFVNKITDEEKVWEFGEQLGDEWEWSLEKSEGETYRCSEVDIFTNFHLVLNSDNDFGYEFYANLETKNIKVVEEHLTRIAAFLLSTQHFERTYLPELKKEKSRIKVDEMEKDFK